MSTHMMITGANGFTGQHACSYFLNQGMKVTAVVQSKKSKDHIQKLFPESQVICCDLTHKYKVDDLIRQNRPDYIVHLAAKNEVRQSWIEPVLYMETNVLSTMYILDSVRRHSKFSQTLVVGSMLNFLLDHKSPQPPHPYSFSKTIQVLVAQSWKYLFDVPVYFVEPSNLIGPGNSNGICGLLAKKIALVENQVDPTPFKLSSLSEKRDFLDVRDAVAAYEQILKRGESGVVYRIGSDRQRSLGELVDTFHLFTKIRLLLDIGEALQSANAKEVKLLILNELGWKPTIPFEQSIQDVLNYFRAENKVGRE